MLEPLDKSDRSLNYTLERKRSRAFFTMLVEQTTLRFWRLGFWILLFLGLWMLELPQFFGNYWLLFFLCLFLVGFFYFFRQDILKYQPIKRDDVDRRLEMVSGLKKGQLSALESALANPEKRLTRELWDSAQKQLLLSVNSLKPTLPRPFLARRDPRALRFLVLMVFFSGVLVAGSDWSRRIWSGILPLSPQYILSQGNEAELWIKPPEYTGLSQLHITSKESSEHIYQVPEDSIIKIRVFSSLGTYFPPALYLGGKIYALSHLGEGLYGIETKIQPGKWLDVRQFFLSRATWRYAFVKDLPPTFVLDPKAGKPSEENSNSRKDDLPLDPALPPEKALTTDKLKDEVINHEILENAQIRFPFLVKDDYGVTEMSMHMSLDEVVEEKPLGSDFLETRSVMSPAHTDYKFQPIFDLSWHTWAGLPVVFNFVVKDHKGQTAQIEPIKITLPERQFKHPVAKALIAARKKLAWASPKNYGEISRDLEAFLVAPDMFQNDLVVFLAIRTASSRLAYARVHNDENSKRAALDVIGLLWETALSIEDGNLSMAMRDMRQAQKELENALRNPEVSDDEISRLMENLRENMARYFMELQREMQKRMAEGEELPIIPPEGLEKIIDPDTLAKMLDQMESELRSGNKDSAREMLSQLQNMLDMMDPSMIAPLPQDMQMMSEGINELQELIEKQEQLRDQTQEQASLKKLMDGTSDGFARTLPHDPTVLKNLGLTDMPPRPENTEQEEYKDQSQLQENKSLNDAQRLLDEKENNSPRQLPLQEDNLIPRPPLPQIDTQPHSAEQKSLRYILGQLMMEAGEQLDKVPENMGLAEQDMRGAEEMLGVNKPDEAVPHQNQAIEHLKEAQQQLSQQLTARMKQITGLGIGSAQQYDPLGRPYGGEKDGKGKYQGSQVKIPEEAEKRRVDEILKELRLRSGELDRPAEEREYYRRLLRQF